MKVHSIVLLMVQFLIFAIVTDFGVYVIGFIEDQSLNHYGYIMINELISIHVPVKGSIVVIDTQVMSIVNNICLNHVRIC